MAKPGKVLGGLLLVWAVMAGLAALPGGMRFLSFETDMAHLAGILMRLEQGARLHFDIATPLGAWGLAPFEMLMRAGVPMGRALVWGQALAGLLLIPLAWWAGVSRLRPGAALALGAAALVIMGALTHGQSDASVTFAMHYNRWSWAILLPVLAIVLLPARAGLPRAPLIDGLAIGAGMFALAMIKASSFMAFAPAVILGLVVVRNWRGLGLALGVGAAGLAWLVATRGADFLMAYAGDLLVVAGSALRVAPGASLAELLAAPAYLPVTLLALAAVLTLRRVVPGVLPVLIVLLPGAYWATFQNYGNDPLWLIPLGLLLWQVSTREEAGRWAAPLRFEALAAVVIVAPVMLNFALSPLRHMQEMPGGFGPLVAAPAHADLQIPAARVNERLLTRKYPEGESAGGAEAPAPRKFAGRALPRCELTGGFVAQVRAHVAALQPAGIEMQPFVADLFAPHWTMAGWAPLRGSAPWYYGGLPGFGGATHLLVPDCPVSTQARDHVLGLVEAEGRAVREALRGPDFTLYRLGE